MNISLIRIVTGLLWLLITWVRCCESAAKRIQAQGKNPNNWVNLYAYLEQNKANNGRYRQALQYVTRIRAYLEHIKTTPQLVNI